MKILLLGATGLVGSRVLQQALVYSTITSIIAPVRKALTIQHNKLYAPVINFDDYDIEAEQWEFDAVICALGTTMNKVKSKALFKKIDYDYPLAFASLAQQKEAKIFVLNSAMGADPQSVFFYSRVKGELEQQLQHMQFASLTFVRPGLIAGQREESRLGEKIGLKISNILKPILPKSLQPNPADKIAQALLISVLEAKSGLNIISSKRLV